MLYPNRGVESKPSSSQRLVLRALPAALFVVLVFAVYADPVFTQRNFTGRDLVPYGLPMERAIHDAWSRGRVPVWNADVSGGRPLLPNPNTGTLYPVRPLLSLLPFPLAMRLFPVLHWASSGVGMYLLLVALRVSPAGAWVGAVTFVFSGVSVAQVFYQPFGPAVALHPWLLWALVRPGPPRRKAVRLSIVWGLLFLLGDAFAIAIALLAAVLWIGLEVARGQRARELGTLAAGLVLAGLLAAPQIVATALLVPQTQRAITPIQVGEALGFRLSAWRLVELIVPFPFGDAWTLEDHRVWGRGAFRCLYATLYSGAVAFIGLMAIARTRLRGARFSRALFVVGFCLAAAGGLVPEAWSRRPSPIPLRYPEKFSVAMILALALAAGIGFDRLREGRRGERWAFGVAVGLSLFAVAAAVWPARVASIAVAAVGTTSQVAGEAADELPAALAEGGLLWCLTIVALELARVPGRARLTGALALLTAIPIAANRRIAPAESPASVFAPTRFARAVERRDPAGAYRTINEADYRPPSPLEREDNRASPWSTELTRRRFQYHVPSLWALGTIFNPDADRGDLSRLDSLRSISMYAASQPDGGPFFSALALRFGIRFRDQQPLPGFGRFGGDARMDWDENPAARPDIRVLERWREEPGAVAALMALPRMEEGEVVLETGRRGGGRGRPGAVDILERSPERLRLEVSAPDPAWLFVLRGYWNYRAIRVDGSPVEAVPAQLAFTAVPVPAGEHAIEWREEIPGIAVSRWGPVLFAVLASASLYSGRAATGSRA